MFENPVFTMFYQKLLATRICINKKIGKAQPRLQGQFEENQPRYYISISMICSLQRLKNWFHKVVNKMERGK